MVRTVKDNQQKAEADIRFEKKTGMFYSIIKEIEYYCSEIDPLEQMVYKLLHTLTDIWFTPVMSVEVYERNNESRWYRSFVVNATMPGDSGDGDQEEGVCAFGYGRFYIGQNNNSNRVYTMSWETAEEARVEADGDEKKLADLWQKRSRHWGNLDADGKTGLTFPFEEDGSSIIPYSEDTWQALVSLGVQLDAINVQLNLLLQPDQLGLIGAGADVLELPKGEQSHE